MNTVIRRDVAYPFGIDAASGQVAQAAYQDHVDQLIRQVLLTDPGERVCLPTFGAGLRRLLFAPFNASVAATTKLIVTQNLQQWLGGQITVRDVTVVPPGTQTAGPAPPPGGVLITVSYVLVETQSVRQTSVTVS